MVPGARAVYGVGWRSANRRTGITCATALAFEAVLTFGLISGDLGQAWIYVAGPQAGTLLAVDLAWALRGLPSRAADEAAQGAVSH